MKNINIILLATVLLATVSACKKDTTPGSSAPGGASGDLKSITSVTAYGGASDTTVTTFTYDNQNRVSTQVLKTIAGSETITYAYYTDSVVMDEVGIASIAYYLNSQGYRTSDNLGDTWTYNSGGYLVSQTLGSAGTTTYTYNSLNQLATQTNIFGADSTVDTYTYPTNPISHAGVSWQMGESTGAQPTTDVNVKNGVKTTITFAYVTNSQGKLSQETVTSSAAGTSVVVSYFTYY